MDYPSLRALIDGEAQNAGRTDLEVLVWLHESVQRWIDVPWLEIQMWLTAQGITRADLITAAGAGTPANRTAAQYILDTISAGMPLYASDERVRSVVAASALSTGAKNALVALAQQMVPRYTLAWSSEPGLGDVANARAL